MFQRVLIGILLVAYYAFAIVLGSIMVTAGLLLCATIVFMPIGIGLILAGVKLVFPR